MTFTRDQTDPAAVVQAQLDAYNAHDADALAAIYGDDAEQFLHPDTLLAAGSAQIRARFRARFADTATRATLLSRVVLGDTVIDHETVRGRDPDGPSRVDLMAIYQVRAGRIAKAWFVFGEKTPDTA